MRRKWSLAFLLLVAASSCIRAHDAKDFDDSILYKIDFEMPDFDKQPDLKDHLRTFYTHEHEKYDCVIPVVEDAKEEQKTDEPELSPLTLLQPIFTASSCSFRIEAYWSYEICHGRHVRQYHEEREGKNIKFQEYYLGKWNEQKTGVATKSWEADQKAGIKYKTTKIENTKYPYFEVEMGDGTWCDITNGPRTTIVRYICYPHGKNEIYSFKETSSCNYEAIILTSVLCMIPAFHPIETKEVSIKCFNSPTEPHKPLSMLRQELSDLQLSDSDIPVSRDAEALVRYTAEGDRIMLLKKIGVGDGDKLVLENLSGTGNAVAVDSSAEMDIPPKTPTTAAESKPETDIIYKPVPSTSTLMPLIEFISGKRCLTGGNGWWKYEFCYGRHVRQFHKDKNVETEVYLGYFKPEVHIQWIRENPMKGPLGSMQTLSLWHRYTNGMVCDRTDVERQVDVKLTCVQHSVSPTSVSMYLLEPKTCQYILVVESPIVCELIHHVDHNGLAHEEELRHLMKGGLPRPRYPLLQEESSVEKKPTASSQVANREANREFDVERKCRGNYWPTAR